MRVVIAPDSFKGSISAAAAAAAVTLPLNESGAITTRTRRS